MAKKRKSNSRAARWAAAVAKIQDGLGKIRTALEESEVEEGVSELQELKEEYEGWRDNLPESFQSSPLGEKLEAVCDLDLDELLEPITDALEEAEGKAEEAEGMDLPLGFGRD